MFKNLKLRQKFTVLLLVILVVGLSVSGLALSALLRQNATNEIALRALTLIDTMTSLREYTLTQIYPELADKLEEKFLPQVVSAYSAREVFEILRKRQEYRDFFYKEAAVNPTNLRDKADPFETKVFERFRKEKDLKQVSGFRSLPGGEIFYIARPLAIKQQSCLQCHSTPEAAPKTMIERFGAVGGFGWHLNEIVAAQFVSLPASKVIEKAYQSSLLIVGIVSAVFIVVIFLVNVFLQRQVIIPLKRITRVAEEVSTGHLEVDFDQISNDEIGNLAKAFKRMKLSLEMAMKRIRRTQGGHTGGTGET
ncbi:MAG: methyl-accepting chemotaxis protein [Scytonema sp. RU_4_4]|nr:methyl-accepting chemotaxis protein [Scytonema sp. RU_4_4]NJR75011.1 methyl-accepting chemotaxis protein [Scytonema sp. CRU_2_7]